MTIDFPDYCPVSRQFVPGQYPVKRFDSISGASITRLYGSKAFNASIKLEYQLTDNEAAEFLASYHDSYGGADDLNLPASIYGGMSEALQEQIRDYYSWRWDGPPQQQTVISGRSKIAVTLLGTLDS